MPCQYNTAKLKQWEYRLQLRAVKCSACILPYFLTDMLCISLNLAISLIPSCGIASVIPLSGSSFRERHGSIVSIWKISTNSQIHGNYYIDWTSYKYQNCPWNLHNGSPCLPYPLKYRYGSVSNSSLNDDLLISFTPKLFLHFKLSDWNSLHKNHKLWQNWNGRFFQIYGRIVIDWSIGNDLQKSDAFDCKQHLNKYISTIRIGLTLKNEMYLRPHDNNIGG